MTHILLIGCGKMGGALAQAWVANNPDFVLDVVDPNPPPPSLAGRIRSCATTVSALSSPLVYDAVILAVKPQQIDDVCAELHGRLPHTTLVISIAAGRETAGLAHALSPTQPIIRAMPNLPASIGQGITAAFATPNVGAPHRALGHTLLAATGTCVWVENEEILDTVTAVSGSGPAYLFLLTETLARSGEKLGLPADLAAQLARTTVIGSAALLGQDPTISPQTWRENVTSKGGTTQAALDVLMASGPGGVQDVFDRALTAARDRARALRQ